MYIKFYRLTTLSDMHLWIFISEIIDHPRDSLFWEHLYSIEPYTPRLKVQWCVGPIPLDRGCIGAWASYPSTEVAMVCWPHTPRPKVHWCVGLLPLDRAWSGVLASYPSTEGALVCGPLTPRSSVKWCVGLIPLDRRCSGLWGSRLVRYFIPRCWEWRLWRYVIWNN